MISAKCAHCGKVGVIWTGSVFWCPQCRRTHLQGWSPRPNPAFAGKPRATEGLSRHVPSGGGPSRNQTVFVCPQCAGRVRPWAVACIHCGYLLPQTRQA